MHCQMPPQQGKLETVPEPDKRKEWKAGQTALIQEAVVVQLKQEVEDNNPGGSLVALYSIESQYVHLNNFPAGDAWEGKGIGHHTSVATWVKSMFNFKG